jgi:hypothetical protein
VVWLHRDAIIKRLDAEIDAESDDAASLSHEDRQRRESEVQAALLEQERIESALVWKGLHEAWLSATGPTAHPWRSWNASA